jgi:RHS repeat-associated protein
VKLGRRAGGSVLTLEWPTAAVFLLATVGHPDHLGTARVVANSSGTPVDDSDFYPFGGERVYLSSSPQNYKFTGKERDAESDLDNFGARYDSSGMGRFMTPDPLLNSGRPWEPKSWNRYAYALNNPLNIVDPTGLYDLVNNCASDDKKCNKQFNRHAKDLKNGLSDLQKKVDEMKDGPEKQRLLAALTAFGTEGDHNGVNATFGALGGDAAAETKFQSNDIGQLSATVTFDPNKIIGSDSYAIDAAHEGTHIENTLTEAVNDYIAHGSLPDLSDFSYEYRGYQTSAWAASALGLNNLSFGGGKYQIWNRSWGAVDGASVTRLITDTYKHVDGTPYVETKPHNPWDN